MVDRYRNYRPRRPLTNPPHKSHRGLYIMVLVLFVVFGGRSVLGKMQSAKPPAQKSSSRPTPKTALLAEPIASSTWNELNQSVTAIINENAGLDISVAVIDIAASTKANYGIQDNFAGASTTKVLTAAAFLHETESGGENINATINGVSAKTLLRRMINRSDNNAWAALNKELTYPKIKSYARSLGMSSYNPTNNAVTASDMALLLQKLYKGELLNEANTKLLYSYMKDTNNEDMIPVAAPEGATLYHKYGQLDDRLHDAAIIDYKNRPLALVIYSKGGASDGSNYATRTQLVQRIAKTVFTTIYSEN